MAARWRSDNGLAARLIGEGGIGPVHCGGHEILRRIFVTVRDRNWQEVPPTHWISDVDDRRGVATLEARHVGDGVDFEWKGLLTAEPDARLVRFSFTGRALQDMEVCRLGLVVLHPVAPLVGSVVTTSGPGGSHQLMVSPRLHPQAIVDGVPMAMTPPYSELSIERPDFGALQLHFDGDLFELEDQRNWGDASFKSYCTPLRLGFPRRVAAGTVIGHSVEIRFERAANADEAPAVRSIKPRKAAAVRSDATFPTIGCQLNAIDALADRGALPWHHYQIDASLLHSAENREKLLETVSTGLELCMTLDDHGTTEPDVLSWLREHAGLIRRILAHGAGTSLPSSAALARLREELGAGASSMPAILAATRGYFVEFNRCVAVPGPADGIAFPLSATVHSDDAATVISNVPALADMVRTARELARHDDLVLAPLALYYPPSQAARFEASLVAPWLVACLCESARARIRSVTLGADVVEAVPASLLGAVLEASGRKQVACGVPRSRDMYAVALQRDDRSVDLLVANLAEEPAIVELSALGMPTSQWTLLTGEAPASLEDRSGELRVPGRGVVCGRAGH